MNKVTFFARLLTNSYKNIANKLLRRKCSSLVKTNESDIKVISSKHVSEDIDFESEINALKITERDSILEPAKSEDISHIAPYFRPTFNFAAYINKSETLQKLVQLGVNLHRIEKMKAAPEYIMKLDFEKDMKQHIFFLHDLGVTADQLGGFITKNPYIFQEDLENLSIRINYLQSKQFNESSITRIVTTNPFWLMFRYFK